MLRLKLQYFGHLMGRTDSSEKTLMLGKIEGGRRRGRQRMRGLEWYHQLDGHEFEWTPGVGDGQGGLVCCSPWDRKESDTTEQLNWTETGKSLFPFHFFHNRLGASAPIPGSALTKFLHSLLCPLHLSPFSSLAQYVPAGMNSFQFPEYIELFLHRNGPIELSIIIIIIKRTFCRDDKVPY